MQKAGKNIFFLFCVCAQVKQSLSLKRHVCCNISMTNLVVLINWGWTVPPPVYEGVTLFVCVCFQVLVCPNTSAFCHLDLSDLALTRAGVHVSSNECGCLKGQMSHLGVRVKTNCLLF